MVLGDSAVSQLLTGNDSVVLRKQRDKMMSQVLSLELMESVRLWARGQVFCTTGISQVQDDIFVTTANGLTF